MLVGHFDIWDVFASKAVGAVKLTAVFQPPQQVAQPMKAAAAASNAACGEEEQEEQEDQEELLGKLAVLSQHADMAQSPPGLCFFVQAQSTALSAQATGLALSPPP